MVQVTAHTSCNLFIALYNWDIYPCFTHMFQIEHIILTLGGVTGLYNLEVGVMNFSPTPIVEQVVSVQIWFMLHDTQRSHDFVNGNFIKLSQKLLLTYAPINLNPWGGSQNYFHVFNNVIPLKRW